MTPYEVISAPFTMWLAPLGTTFPLIDIAPAGDWIKVGTSGPLNYDRSTGVMVNQPQTIVKWRSLGDTAPRKAFRTEEDFMVSLAIADLTLEQWAMVLNHNTVTDVPAGGEAGYRKLGLSRGTTITEKALLLRGPSPYDELLNLQFEIPRAIHTGSPQPKVGSIGEPALLSFNWDAMIDANAASDEEYLGRIIASDAAAVS